MAEVERADYPNLTIRAVITVDPVSARNGGYARPPYWKRCHVQ
jgi:hypothetical protein